MATEKNKKGDSKPAELSNVVRNKTFGIAVAEWNKEVTEKLLDGALNYLLKNSIKNENILVKWIPGAYELPLAVQLLIEHQKVDACIALGCLIKGETQHFEYIAGAASNHLSLLALKYNRPVGFGLLTVNNMEQAMDRVGGKEGHKGEEAADAALKMLSLKLDLNGETEREKSGKSSIGFV